MTLKLLWEHIYIVLMSMALATVVGLPLGIVCYFCPKVRKPIMWVVDVLQTIPALALLGMIMVVAGAGKPTVIIGIALYSLLPIVSNTCLGLEQVDEGIKEAARGMGMGRWKRLQSVELPLAFPVIFTGLRIAAVNSVGSAVFAAFVEELERQGCAVTTVADAEACKKSVQGHAPALMGDDRHLDPLRQLRPGQPHYLERGKPGKLVGDWNLVVPPFLYGKTWEET